MGAYLYIARTYPWAPSYTCPHRLPPLPRCFGRSPRHCALGTTMNTAGSSQTAGSFASLDDVLHQLTTSTNLNNLHHYLKSFAPKESRDIILASTLSSGQDPLSVLDPQRNTLGYLYILYVHRSRSSDMYLTILQFSKIAFSSRANPHDQCYRNLLQPV